MSESSDIVIEKLPVEEVNKRIDDPPAAGEQPAKQDEESESAKKLSKKDSGRKSASPKSASPTTPRRTKSKDKKQGSSDSDTEGDVLTESEEIGASNGIVAGQSEFFDAAFRRFNLKNKNAPNGHVPKPRSAHASTVIGHKIYIFGGLAEPIEQLSCFGDLHVLNAGRKTWKRAKHHSHKADFPIPRFGHSANAVGNKVYIFGGLDSTQTHCLNDLHVFDIVDRKWSRPETHGTAPAPRAYHTSCVIGNKIFVFGAADKLRKFGDGYVFDTEENKWNSINFSSVPFLRRYFHTCYSHNNRVYLFAGESTEETHYFNDIYVLDADSLEFGPEILASGAEPRRRSMHAVTQLTLDEHEYLVVFGGKGEEHFNDIVLLDLDTHKWYNCHIKGKPAMPRHAHTASTVGSKIYIFGGYGIKHRLNDVLILDFTRAKLMLTPNQEPEVDNEKDGKDHKKKDKE